MPFLKEFDLDAPYVKNTETIMHLSNSQKIDVDAAIKIDYEANWKWKRRKFALETRCVTSYYSRLFQSLKNDKCWKINVECVPVLTKSPSVIGGVYEVQIQYDPVEFFSVEAYEKKIIALNLLSEAIALVIELEKWDSKAFDDVVEQITRANYRNEWLFGKKVISSDKKRSAQLKCRQEIDEAIISVEIENRKLKKIETIDLKRIEPDERVFYKWFGKIVWESHDVIVIYDKANNEYYRGLV